MKTYFFIALAMLCQSAKAQNDASPAIYLQDGKTIVAEKIRLRTGAFNDLYLLADGKRIQANKVKFFQSDRGFFASTQHLNLMQMAGFAERIEEGRVNLFQELPRVYDWDRQRYPYQQHEQARYQLYYNKGLEHIKPISYANLMTDLRDNQQSMDFLAVYRKKRNTANIFIGLAGASLLAGLVSFVSFDNGPISNRPFESRSNFKMPYFSYALMGVGTGLGFVGTMNYLRSRDQLVNAIDAYNR